MAKDSGKPLAQRFPGLSGLHKRHYGLTSRVAANYAEAASVCLTRHHIPPQEMTVSDDDWGDRSYHMNWRPATVRQVAAWANTEDATRDGAYGLVLAALEVHLGKFAIRRTQAKSGADYYVGKEGDDINARDGLLDLEGLMRLEISGILDAKSDSDWKQRLRQKVQQAQSVSRNEPAIAGVAVFNLCRVVFRKAC